jgi:hypothetical protein
MELYVFTMAASRMPFSNSGPACIRKWLPLPLKASITFVFFLKQEIDQTDYKSGDNDKNNQLKESLQDSVDNESS